MKCDLSQHADLRYNHGSELQNNPPSLLFSFFRRIPYTYIFLYKMIMLMCGFHLRAVRRESDHI